MANDLVIQKMMKLGGQVYLIVKRFTDDPTRPEASMARARDRVIQAVSTPLGKRSDGSSEHHVVTVGVLSTERKIPIVAAEAGPGEWILSSPVVEALGREQLDAWLDTHRKQGWSVPAVPQ